MPAVLLTLNLTLTLTLTLALALTLTLTLALTLTLTLSVSPAEQVHRIDAFDALRLELRIGAPLDQLITSEAIHSYAALFRFILRVQRATLALSGLWTVLHNPTAAGGGAGATTDASRGRGTLQEAHAWHVLRLHVHELRHFVSEVL